MKTACSQKPRKLAFSLTETMVAVALLSTVVASFYLGLSMAFSLLEAARQNLRATQILVERTETLRLLKWTQVADTSFIPAAFVETYDPKDPGSIRYDGTITVEPLSGPENYSSDMREITVQLRWHSGNVLRTRSMQTLVSREGIQNYVF